MDPQFPAPVTVGADRWLAMLASTGDFSVAVMGRAILRRGWTMGPRIVAGHLLYTLEKGHVVGSVAGRSVELGPAGSAWVQAGAEHSFRLGDSAAAEGSSILYCRFFVGRGATPYRVASDAVTLESDPQVCELMSALIGPGLPDASLELLRQRSLLTSSLCHVLAGASRPGVARGLRADQRRRAVTFIQSHLATGLTVGEVARHVGLNAAYFAQQFKLSFGVSPRAFLTAARIRAAAAMLAGSNLPIKQAAKEVGFDDIYHFSKQFKRVMRQSPRRWRAQSGGGG